MSAGTSRLDALLPDLLAVRRDLHRHPELGWAEHRTTGVVADRLTAAGLAPRVLAAGTGLVCDLGVGDGPRVLLRADLDALPLTETTGLPWRSEVAGVAHACGHDVHTTVLLGAALLLAADPSAPPVRVLFQPAEEKMPGGALVAIDDGVLDGVSRAYALHCDPALQVGQVGLRPGPITAAADQLTVRLTGPGGHTSRPHLTVDLVQAMGLVLTGLPQLLDRRVDTRSGLLLTWGTAHAGTALNAIPSTAEMVGTLRVLDSDLWHRLPELVEELVHAAAAGTGAGVEVEHLQGVAPVDNDPGVVAGWEQRLRERLGEEAVTTTPQSLGGEDFGWVVQQVPGALARLGVRPVGVDRAPDLHTGAFDVDEACVAVGVQALLAAVSA